MGEHTQNTQTHKELLLMQISLFFFFSCLCQDKNHVADKDDREQHVVVAERKSHKKSTNTVSHSDVYSYQSAQALYIKCATIDALL